MKSLRILGLIGAALLLCASVVWAQDRGAITGTVTDPSGAAMPRIGVTLRNVARGEVLKLETTSAGQYAVPDLIPGTYTITAAADGFRPTTKTDVMVRLGDTIRVDIQMTIGGVQEKIEVVAEAQLLRPDSSDVGTTVERQAIFNLPLQVGGSARDPLAFAKLTPGFVGQSTNSAVEYTTFYSINGGQAQGTSILVDGASVELVGIQTQYNTGVSVDAVEEFKVMSGNYSAEYGRSIGGIINLTLKSGTNDFHGLVYDFLRNEKFDARGFFNASRLPNRQNNFGALFSGPVQIPKAYHGRDRSFFMFAYEGFRFRQGALSQFLTYPIDPFRSGDFARLVDDTGKQIPIYDSATTELLADGTVRRQVFPGNAIPGSRLDPVAKNIIAMIPKLDFPGRLTENILSNQQTIVDTNIYTMKLDHSFSPSHKIAGSYSRAQEVDADVRSFGALGQSGGVTQKTHYARLSYDAVISPTVFNHVQFGASRRWRRESPSDTGDWASKIGLKGVGTSQFPDIRISGYGTADGETFGAGPFGGIWVAADNSYQWNEALTLVRGRHLLKFGGEVRKQQFNVNSLNMHSGRFFFSPGQTGLPGAKERTGESFASFFLGEVNNASFNYTGAQYAHRLASMGIFGQDDFKVNSRLTLNLGLRYERFWPVSDANGRLSVLDPNKPNPGAGNRPGALVFAGEGEGRNGQTRFQEIYNRAFGPRFGLAYKWNGRTVVRAGYGIHYQELRDPTWGAGGEGFFTTASYTSTNGYSQAFKFGEGFPTNFPKPPFLDPAFSNGRNIPYVEPESGRPPVAQNWHLSIQRQLTQGLVLETAYVGNNGHHLISNNRIPNQVDPRYLALGSLLRADINSPDARAAGIVKPYPTFSGIVAQALRPFPQYLALSTAAPFVSDKTGNSTYNALQVKLQGRVRGTMLLASYAFSKSINDGANSRDLDSYVPNLRGSQDGFNRRAEKTLASMDTPHNLALSSISELPFGPKKKYLQKGLASKLAGGWAVSSVLIYQSGVPIRTPSPASSNVQLFAGAIRPDRPAGVPAVTSAAQSGDFDPGRDRYLNRAAWTSPAPFQFGNAARMSDARSLPFMDEDFSVLKSNKFGERVDAQFRFEVFNLFNRTVFGLPNTSLGSSQFGMIVAQQNKPRTMQAGLKLVF